MLTTENSLKGQQTPASTSTHDTGITIPKAQFYALKRKLRRIVRELQQVQAEEHQRLLAEERRKNVAYYFILVNGHFERFVTFCDNYQSNDPFQDMVNYARAKIEEL